MNFSDWLELNESSLNDILKSTINAFPNTSKRQYATNPIKIVKLNWSPFPGMNTLFVRAIAQNEGREYNPLILFKKVNYSKDGISLVANDGKKYDLKPMSSKENDILLRCNCGDFYWRGNYADHLDHSLYGKKRKKYKSLGIGPPANPENTPMMCKHLIKLTKVLKEAGILTS
ncbi:MAG: hypothetical protein DWQ19_12070 [Crenarchaeota archaeon]|nr:MAG: hypothetical protein DWQ19_12070 [Thermoproteota archaeon]